MCTYKATEINDATHSSMHETDDIESCHSDSNDYLSIEALFTRIIGCVQSSMKSFIW